MVDRIHACAYLQKRRGRSFWGVATAWLMGLCRETVGVVRARYPKRWMRHVHTSSLRKSRGTVSLMRQLLACPSVARSFAV